jgi:hypothetical protein
MFFSSLVAMAACFQIGFHYGVRPYRELLTQNQSSAVAEIAVSQDKTLFIVSLLGFASALAAFAIAIWNRAKKEPIQASETTRGK